MIEMTEYKEGKKSGYSILFKKNKPYVGYLYNDDVCSKTWNKVNDFN